MNVKINEGWKKLLEGEFSQPYFDGIRTTLYDARAKALQVYPPGRLIFNAFELTPPEKLKVVIIGQDPYHNPGEAMGLCFSVPKNIRKPPSLNNIFKELNRDLQLPIPEHGDLSSWAAEGVFLLNAFLTVEKNRPASHQHIGWQQFTDAVIRTISDHKEHIVFILWGNFAKGKKQLIDTLSLIHI